MRIAAVDVASRRHQVFLEGSHSQLPNEEAAMGAWLDGLPEGTVVVLEATGGYGLPLAELAHGRGLTVYVLAPRQVAAFRRGLGLRAKTDKKDAELILEFARLHMQGLHPFKPLEEPYRTLRALSRERLALSRDRERLKKRAAHFGYEEILMAFERQLEQLTARIEALLKEIPKARELQAIPGVGPQLAAVSLAAFAGAAFKSKHAFVAYAGLDLAVRDSGEMRGRRYLTRRGDKSLRCLLFMAGFAATNSKEYRDYYRSLKEDRKLKPTEAQIVLARKIARRIYGVMRT